jgi:hypothetical protein
MAAFAASFRTFKVFVSYSSRDEGLAQKLVNYLETEGKISCFLAPRNIAPLEEWLPKLSSEIRERNLVLLLYTPHAAESEYVRSEIREADTCGRQVWMVMERNTRLDPWFDRFVFTKRNAFTFDAGQENESFKLLRDALNAEWEKHNRGTIDPADSPYPGFQPFGKAFENYYFGRGEDARELAEALTQPHNTRDATKDDRLLFLYGPSGVGKTSLLTVGLRKTLPEKNWLGDPILVPDHIKTDSTGYHLMRAALEQLRGSSDSKPASAIQKEAIVGEIFAAARDHKSAQDVKYAQHIFIFDQTEELFGREEQSVQSHEFLNYAKNLLERCWLDEVHVRIIVSFREELRGKAELYTEQLQIAPWWRPIRKLSRRQAMECIMEPAKARGVDFDPELAKALAGALAAREGGDYTVEPRKISQVCKRLWEKAGRMPGGPHSAINAGCLVEWKGSPRERVDGYVRDVLEKDLDEAVKEIAERPNLLEGAPNTSQDAKEEFIRLSLLGFVSSRKRTRVPETFQNGERCVGRLPGKVVDELVGRGLVRRCGDAPEYELVHDFLAEAIDDKYRGRVAFELSFNQLASTLLIAQGQESFNRETTLLADLEPARENKLYFREDEAEFLLRCALGDLHKNAQGKTISPFGWAEKLAAASPSKLAEVLHDALAQDRDVSVRLDVLGLLHNAEIRGRIEDLRKLYEQVVQLALESEIEVRKAACSVLIAADDQASLQRLFDALKDQRTRGAARMAIGLLRDAVDTLHGTGAAYWPRWKKLALFSRAGILAELAALRLKESFGKIAFITVVSAVFTAIGAAVPFVVVGSFGASLTMGEPNAAAGFLQGSAGGFVWGFAVSLLLLLYTVIWRGGRIRRSMQDSLAVFAATVLGGFFGGICNSAMIASTFSPDIRAASGWTKNVTDPCVQQAVRTGHSLFLQNLLDAVETGYAWVLPILGIALGVGVAWSLVRILGDPAEKWAGDQRAIQTPAGAWQSIKTIAGRVFPPAWRNVAAVTLGAFAALVVLQAFKSGVKVAASLPPVGWRTAGISLVVLFGSVFCEIGFLFGVLSVRVGASMGQYPDFLRPGEAQGNVSVSAAGAAGIVPTTKRRMSE